MGRGYRRAPVKLVFSDPELDGFNVWIKRVSIGRVMGLMELAEQVDVADPANSREQIQALLDSLYPCLVAWNLEDPEDPFDDDSPAVPVPLTPEALRDQDVALVMAIVEGMTQASGGVADPLERSSNGGGPSETLMALQSLEHSPEPSTS